MEQISIYLEKFKKKDYNQKTLKEAIFIVLNSFFKGKVCERDIEIRDGFVKIKAHPVLKSELFIKQEQIKEGIETRIGKKVIRIV